MKCYVGIGSNLGNPRANLDRAVALLRPLRVSPYFENPPLLPDGAPTDWHRSFWNAVIELEWTRSPRELLQHLQDIEREMGRVRSEKWAPRVIDLDLLEFGHQIISENGLIVPHPESANRQFVMTPWKMLAPERALQSSRALPDKLPAWMGIVNLTPDSFSDGGSADIWPKLEAWMQEGVHWIDLGAESTRPGANPVTPEVEWLRLRDVLREVRTARVSIDTRHAYTAERALEMGAQVINDVSAGADPRMLEIVRAANCEYIFMHHKTIPAIAGDRWDVDDPIAALKTWAWEKMNRLVDAGISPSKMIFDPGIGFGKSPLQNIEILKRVDELLDLPVRVLIGHSRKSFMDKWGKRPAQDRDAETLALSLQLARKGVDILRVHEPDKHQRAWRASREIE